MGVLLSGKEKEFLVDLLSGRVEKYSYHYQRVLRKRILDKRKNLTEDVYLITKAEDKLQNLPSRKKKVMKK
ncbi:MAG TPA: hypothetical protein VGQ13_10170 [Nitrososphaera sp.]|jgi:hypothetical protein|nr:hypothetical protein [Nitrososphaera sp.]